MQSLGKSDELERAATVGGPRLRVMFLVNNMGYGGAELQVGSLATVLARRGHRVLLVVLLTFLDFRSQLEASGVKTLELALDKSVGFVGAVPRLTSEIRRWAPDVLHSHLFWSIQVGRLAAKLAGGIPTVDTTHQSWEPRYRYAAYRATARWSRLWTNVSSVGRENYVNAGAVPANKARTVPNGLAVNAFAFDAARRDALRTAADLGRRFIWLTVGSFRDESKDYNGLLRAFAGLRDLDDVELWIVGSGRLIEEKKRAARMLGVADRVRFLGLRADVRDLMLTADGFVLGSAWEALPMVLLEASASSLPVVCTDVGSNREIVLDGKTGLVVPPGDPQRLSAAMRRVMECTPEERASLGRAGSSRTRALYDIEKIATSWEETYGHLRRA